MKTVLIAMLAAGISSTALAQSAGPVVRIETGSVRGTVENGVASWKGIPFAAPPVGPLRWRAPQPAARWSGVKDTTAFGNDCMQKPFGGDAAPVGTTPAEDCLYLNVWKPARAGARARARLPVILWIYGGGFVNGGASSPTYSGANLARKGVMFVSFNYRVGRFGTFAHPALAKANEDGGLAGNFGYLDQIAALKWVRRNIAAFGGDSANITIIGESAGGSSVHTLLTSPMTRGMVQRAVVMSGGSGQTRGTAAGAEQMGTEFMAAKGIAADDPQALAKMRALSAEEVTDGLSLAQMFTGKVRHYASPFADGKIAVDVVKAYDSGAWTKVPVMIGATSADLPDTITGARTLSGLLTRKGAPVYTYRFSYVAQSLTLKGAPHASDIPYFFDTQAIKLRGATTPRDNGMGAQISDYLVNFARTGNPNGRALPQWPRYDARADVIMDFAADGKSRAIRDPLTAKP